MAKYDIFISLSQKDFDEVNEFVNMLKLHIPSLLCSYYATKEEFDDVVKKRIEESACVLYAQSEESNKLPRIMQEVTYAKSIGKQVVPLLLKGAKMRGWYMFKYGSLNFVDSTNSVAVEGLINELRGWIGEVADNAADETAECPDTEVSVEIDELIESGDSEEVADSVDNTQKTVKDVVENNVVYEPDDSSLFEMFSYEVFADEPLPEEADMDEPLADDTFEEENDDEVLLPEKYGTLRKIVAHADTVTDTTDSRVAEEPAVSVDIPEEQTENKEKQGSISFLIMIVILTVGILWAFSGRENYDIQRNYSQGFAAVKKDGKWGYINKSKKLIVPLKYDSADDYTNGYAVVGLKGKWGYVNSVGKEIVPIQYEEALPFVNDRGCVKLNGKFGFVDTFGRIIVFPKYDNPISFIDDYASVVIGGKWGVVDKNGKEIVSLNYDDVGRFCNGVVKVKKAGKFGLIGIDGTIVTGPIYDKVRDLSEDCAAVQKNGKWGFVDNKGNTIVYPKYAKVEDFVNSRAAVMSDGKWGFVDNSGKEVIPLRYDSVNSFTTTPYTGTFTVVIQDGKQILIDKNGAPIKM